MGIHQTKSLLKTYYSGKLTLDTEEYLQKGFNSDCLILQEFLDHFWDPKSVDFLDKSNIQEKKKPTEEQMKDNHNKSALQEKYLLPEIPLTQQNSPNVFDLTSTLDQKEPHSPQEITQFSQLQLKRMNILLMAFVKKVLITNTENSSIDCIRKYFASEIKDKAKEEFSSIGLDIFIRLLSDLSQENIKIKEDTIDFLFKNSVYVPPLALWGESKEHFILDKGIDNVISYMIKLIKDEKEQPIVKQKALKVILNLSLAKGSLKNLLEFIEIYNYIPEKIDLNHELNLFKNEYIKMSLSYTEESNKKIKSDLWNYNNAEEAKKKTQMTGFATQTESVEQKKLTYSSTSDGSYIYIYISNGTLLKIGSGYNNTMLGKVYLKKEKFHAGEKGTIAIVEKVLFFRSTKLDPNPLVCLDPNTFEEIPFEYDIDLKSMNHLWTEGKRIEIEFPHSAYKDMATIIERKKNANNDEKVSNFRPSTSSPMLSDGRYIYIISKWFDDVESALDQKDDESDDEGTMAHKLNKNNTISIYGVDVYDPLNNMNHVKSVKLSSINQKKDLESKKIDDLALGLKPKETEKSISSLLDNDLYYTNGNILIIGEYKFSLLNGELLETLSQTQKDAKCFCYDYSNNLIWGVYCEKRINIVSYFNKNAKPIFEYPESNEKFSPCSLEKIIKFSEDEIKSKQIKTEDSLKNYQREATLYILNLEDMNTTKDFQMIQLLSQSNINIADYKKHIQCLILGIIAKLSDFYGQTPDLRIANTDEDRGRIYSQIMRRPFCVKLEPIVFEKLISLVTQYSTDALQGKFNKTDMYCLLSTIKITRTNLKCLALSDIDINLFIQNQVNPFKLMKEFIFKIFEMFHLKSSSLPKEEKDLIKALYDECKIILMISVNILYQNNSDIIKVLLDHFSKFNSSTYSKDIVKCILIWMSHEDNLKHFISKITSEDKIEIFEISQQVSLWEVEKFEKVLQLKLKGGKDDKGMVRSEEELISFKFISTLQSAVLSELSKRLVNDQYETIQEEKDVCAFTKGLFTNVHKVFILFNKFIDQYQKQVDIEYNKTYSNNVKKEDNKDEQTGSIGSNKMKDEDEDEEIITTSKAKIQQTQQQLDDTQKEQVTIEQYREEKIKEIYSTFINQLLSEDLLILKTFIFHLSSLSILSSDYILSLLLIDSFNEIIKEINAFTQKIPQTQNSSAKDQGQYKEIIIESDHPLKSYYKKVFEINIPNEKNLFLEFNPQSSFVSSLTTTVGSGAPQLNAFANPNNNANLEPYISLFADKETKKPLGSYTKMKTFPTDPIHILQNPIYLLFVCERVPVTNVYGFKLKVYNYLKKEKKIDELLFDILRCLSWVAGKCSAQLLRGIFSKSLLKNEEEDQKYGVILNSKLLEGGINYEDIHKDNDPILGNVIEIYNERLKSISNKAKPLNPYLDITNDKCIQVLKAFQRRFAINNPGALVGGDNAFKLVIAAFMCTVYHALEEKEWEELVNSFKGDDEALSKHCYSDLLFKKYTLANKMRGWLIEKRKNLDEALENQKSKNYSENENEQSSETLLKKIIDQTITKAKFLLKLNTTNSLQGEENLISLSNSIISILQSNISIKKLTYRIKIASIRALGRTIGLKEMEKLFIENLNGKVSQDLIGWFSTSLRSDDCPLSHYLDNVSGCGKFYEEQIQIAFHSLLSIIINKFIKIENETELKSFLDSLLWRYGAEDHEFIVETGIFNIIWGNFNDTIKDSWGKELKKERIKENNTSTILAAENNFNRSQPKIAKQEEEVTITQTNLSHDLIELFEILANICFGRAIGLDNTSGANAQGSQSGNNANQNLTKMKSVQLQLTRRVSQLNDNSSDSVIQNVCNVLFGEISKAITSYLRYRGISYNLWVQYEEQEEEQMNAKSKAGPAVRTFAYNGNRTRQRYEYSESGDYDNYLDQEENYDNIDNAYTNNYETIDGRQVGLGELKKDTKEILMENEGTNYYYKEDLINLFDEFLFGKHNKPLIQSKMTKISLSKEELITYVNNQDLPVYNAEFLNRILHVAYKASIQQQDSKIMNIITSSDYISLLLTLLRLCSTDNKLLIVKVLTGISLNSTWDTLNEATELFKVQIEESTGRCTLNADNFIELLISILEEIKEKAWNNSYDSDSSYIISSMLLNLLRELMSKDYLKAFINTLINNEFSKGKYDKQFIRKEILLGIIGGDFFGEAMGSKVLVPCESKENHIKGQIDFSFSKKDYQEQYQYGTIIGFASSFDSFLTIKKTISQPAGRTFGGINNTTTTAKESKKASNPIYLTPNNYSENRVGVLLDSSLKQDNFNLSEIIPKIYSQYEILPVQKFKSKEEIELSSKTLEELLVFLNDDTQNSYQQRNLKTTILRFLSNYLTDEKAIKQLHQIPNVNEYIKKINTIAMKLINFQKSYMNLELLEEQRYRLLNYLTMTKESISEISQLSMSFKTNDLFIIHSSCKDGIINLCYNIISSTDATMLPSIKEYSQFEFDENNKDAPATCIFSENPAEYISNNKNKAKDLHVILTPSDIKAIPKDDFYILVQISQASYDEIKEITNDPNQSFKFDSSPEDDLVEMLVNDFGFDKKSVSKALENTQEKEDVNKLILNVISEIDKKNIDVITEEDIKIEEVEDLLENEPKNECFEFKDFKPNTPEFYDSLFIEDTLMLFKLYEQINEKISSLLCRRIVFNILSFSSNNEDYASLSSDISFDSIYHLLKLLTHEGLFVNSLGLESKLLLDVKKFLNDINQTTNNAALVSHFTKKAFSEFDAILKEKPFSSQFIINNESSVIQHSFIFFAIWHLMIKSYARDSNCFDEDYYNIFDSLSGIIPKIKDNKQIIWLIIEFLIQYCHRILYEIPANPALIVNMKHFHSLKNIANLNPLLMKSISREGNKNLSRRTQMLTELLVFINQIDSKIAAYRDKETLPQYKNDKYIYDTNIKVDNFISRLSTILDIMKDFFEKEYLKFLAWSELNPNIISSSVQSFESNHLYSKGPHTYLLRVPNTSALTIDIHPDTNFDKNDSLLFSYDCNGANPIDSQIITPGKQFVLNSSHAFINFPSNYLTEIYAMGNNPYSRFGFSGDEITSPKLIESLSNLVIKDFYIGDTYTIALTEQGNPLVCGSGLISGSKKSSSIYTKENKATTSKVIDCELISNICLFGTKLIVGTQTNSFYSNCLTFLNDYSNNQNSQNPDDLTNLSFNHRIKQISISDTHALILSEEGTVYHMGNNDYYQNGIKECTRNTKFVLIQLPKKYKCEMLSTGEYFSVFLMKDLELGKTIICSAGWSKNGRTGTGKSEEVIALKEVSCEEIDNKEFKYVTCDKTSAAAISTDGYLYTWGTNGKGQLGYSDPPEVNEPKLVKFFAEDYDVQDIKMNNQQSLVLALEKSTQKMCVYSFGENSNPKFTQQNIPKKGSIPTPVRLTFFDDKNPYKLCIGNKSYAIMCEAKKYQSIRDDHNIPCSLCSNMIVGLLFSNLKGDAYNCEKCTFATQIQLNQHQLVFSAPLKANMALLVSTISNQPPLKYSTEKATSIICEQCSTDLIKSKQVYYTYLNDKKPKFICHLCLIRFPSVIHTIKVYLKCSMDDSLYQSIIADSSLELLNENNYYSQSMSYGYKFTVTPMYNEYGYKQVIDAHEKSFKTFTQEINNYNKFEIYEQFVDLLNDISQKFNKSLYNFTQKDLVFKKEDLSVRSSLLEIKYESLWKMFILLKELNNKVKEILPYIDFSKSIQDNNRLFTYFNKISSLIFWETKNELISDCLEKSASTGEVHTLRINRLKVSKFIEKGKVDNTGEHTVFGQIFLHLKTKPVTVFRKSKKIKNQLFFITFVGEASMDAGGPYRDCLTQAEAELQSNALPLFIPSPNQKNEAGKCREKWIVNPDSDSPVHLEMFRFLGCLIGYAMRTGEFLNLDLPSIFWKSLLELPLERKDLEMIDKYTIQSLDDISNIHKKANITKETFASMVDQKYTTILSNGKEIELIPNGKNIDLTYESRLEYCELVEKTRLNEGRVQHSAIRAGLERVVPIGILKLLSWNELEMLVCGKPIPDIGLLRENTTYSGCNENDTVVINLWRCLEEFSAEERSMYLRFVWGRSRLPLTSKDFTMKHHIEIYHHPNPDLSLPKSHTCFFSLEIPKYSTYEILKVKLKYAITHCQAIDTDGQAAEIWDDEE